MFLLKSENEFKSPEPIDPIDLNIVKRFGMVLKFSQPINA
jgi:hypothetical protein